MKELTKDKPQIVPPLERVELLDPRLGYRVVMTGVPYANEPKAVLALKEAESIVEKLINC